MTVIRRHPNKEFARLGKKRFEEIKDQFTEADKGNFLAIDIETGDYVLNEDEIEARMRLRELHQDAVVWVERIGYRALRSMGGRFL